MKVYGCCFIKYVINAVKGGTKYRGNFNIYYAVVFLINVCVCVCVCVCVFNA
jgi:hypothetical protein